MGATLSLKGGKRMAEKDLTRLRGKLLESRREIFDRLRQLESDWKELEEREIELEEEAQKVDLTSLFDRLDEAASSPFL